jgi:adenylate cyclase
MFLGSAQQIPHALVLLEQAIERDRRYGPALALAAICCFRLLADGRSTDPETHRRKGMDFARRAIEAAQDDPGVLANAALALAFFGDDIETMLALLDRALMLNPSSARAWQISGNLRYWAGDLSLAVEHIQSALRLSPRSRVGPSMLILGAVDFFQGRLESAAQKLLIAVQEDPTHPAPLRFLAATYAQMGRLEEAHQTAERLRSFAPVIPDANYMRNRDHREFFLSGLRMAAGNKG